MEWKNDHSMLSPDQKASMIMLIMEGRGEHVKIKECQERLEEIQKEIEKIWENKNGA